MNVTQRIKVDFVQYRSEAEPVLINVTPQLVDEKGTVVGSLPFENVVASQDALAEAAKARGASEWGDADIEAAIRGATRTAPNPEAEIEKEPGDESVLRTIDVPRFPDAGIAW